MRSQCPRANRISLAQRACVFVDGIKLPAIIRDVSMTGVRVECAEPFEIGETINLRVGDDQEYQAQVRWTGFGEFGAELLSKPISI